MATSNRFDPFRELDRLLGEGLRGVSGSTTLPMDLYKDGDRFVGLIDMPGVDPASIDIDVEDRTLTVRAQRRAPEADDAQWLSRERPSGTFARQLSLGRGLALDRIEADYRDGVLVLSIPVAEQAKPRKIQVKHSAADQVEGQEVAGQESAQDAAAVEAPQQPSGE